MHIAIYYIYVWSYINILSVGMQLSIKNVQANGENHNYNDCVNSYLTIRTYCSYIYSNTFVWPCDDI